MSRLRLAPVAGCIAFVSVIGAGSGGASSGPSATPKGKPIVLGLPIALSGALNFADGSFYTAIQIAVKDFNNSGGALGRPLKIAAQDTKSDIAASGTAALDLIAKGAHFILPTTDYDYGSPAARVAQQKGLLALTNVGDPRFGVKGVGPNVYNIYQATPTEGAAAAQFAYSIKKWRRAYVLEDTTLNYTKTLCKYFKESWQHLKGSTVGSDTFQNGDPSIAGQITKLKSINPKPDFIMSCSYPPGGFSALRQIRAAGITTPILGGAAFDGTFWLTSIPQQLNFYSLSEGVISGDPNPIRESIFRKYRQTTHKQVVYTTTLLGGYSIVQALVKAIKRAGSIETKAVKAQLDKFRNEPLVIGPTTWTPQCHIRRGAPFVIIQPTTKPVTVNGIRAQKVNYIATVKPKFVPKAIC